MEHGVLATYIHIYIHIFFMSYKKKEIEMSCKITKGKEFQLCIGGNICRNNNILDKANTPTTY